MGAIGGYPSSKVISPMVSGRCRATMARIAVCVRSSWSGDTVRMSPVTTVVAAMTLCLPSAVALSPVLSNFTCDPPAISPGLNAK